MYRVKEIFYTLQGEGAHAGRPAVFCRFTGCNLWTGHEEHRVRAICKFCDTDFVGTDGSGGGRFRTAADLAAAVAAFWPADVAGGERYVVCTGGEPLLQLDHAAVEALHESGFTVAVETNGTRAAPPGIDWICVSPKSTAELVLTSGDELKLVFPQHDARPERYEELDFARFSLQPMDGPDAAANTRLALEYCLTNPRWRLSLQTHKIVGIR
ncbi:7-carboxy-7-deazaguanine synthase [Nonomuraea phyllanthi]|uniref:7-carboxy-7-deazaguanine synthase n=1 Tax=Nonomuraea phyllanthi TaxID=2219224 RepID=A0A5C4UUU7_9ACTN|nr:7-carboxy-7-deazaguanine synthase [Nonomuraea phyllanthi]QFY10350.1 7-carboxy-7-deazaguanine synthase [Nonomuraea phyllanthi]